LLVTVCEDAFLSLTDYQASPAEFLFFPKATIGPDKGRRCPEVWLRGDYDLLSGSDLDEQVGLYLEAREEARRILLLAKAEEDRRKTEEKRRPDDKADPFDDLFGREDPRKK